MVRNHSKTPLMISLPRNLRCIFGVMRIWKLAFVAQKLSHRYCHCGQAKISAVGIAERERGVNEMEAALGFTLAIHDRAADHGQIHKMIELAQFKLVREQKGQLVDL